MRTFGLGLSGFRVILQVLQSGVFGASEKTDSCIGSGFGVTKLTYPETRDRDPQKSAASSVCGEAGWAVHYALSYRPTCPSKAGPEGRVGGYVNLHEARNPKLLLRVQKQRVLHNR